MSNALDSTSRPSFAQRIGVMVLEIGERALVAVLYYGLVSRLLADFSASHNAANLLMLASESVVVVLAIIRKPANEVSLRPRDWVLAFGASFLPLYLAPARVEPIGPAWIGLGLQATAFVAQLSAKIYLFRNFGITPAVRGIAERGPYVIVRHPMYAAYFVGQLGFLYAFPTAWNAALLTVWAIAQIMRIFAEERVLERSPVYRDYLRRVRWRLIPGVF